VLRACSKDNLEVFCCLFS